VATEPNRRRPSKRPPRVSPNPLGGRERTVWKCFGRLLGRKGEDGYYNNRLMWFPTMEALEAERATWRARLAAPRFEELERHFGVPCPAELRWLYEAHDLAASDGFVEVKGSEGVVSVCVWPADAQTLKECWSNVGATRFPFAELMGSFYFVEFVSDASAPCPVYFTELRSEEAVPEAESLRQFMRRVGPAG
jgi:hypothetical protein